MSRKHPIIVVTGSSGAGTTTVTSVFENIFRRESIRAAVIEGDAFHRFSRREMNDRIERGDAQGIR
jgi:phosphoribulokinase